jgi:hypothetical protein
MRQLAGSAAAEQRPLRLTQGGQHAVADLLAAERLGLGLPWLRICEAGVIKVV